jgi:hypothetical protein
MAQALEVGRVLSAGTTAFVVGCRVNQLETPSFGALVRAPLKSAYQVYGLIHDIRIQDDGLIRQLVTAEQVSEEVLRDNRERRIVPVELSVAVLGCEVGGQIRHHLPPRPPLSLDLVYLCDRAEVQRFTAAGHFGYLRHLLRLQDLPTGEILAAHIRHARSAHPDPHAWTEAAVKELITLLRDDYSTLTSVLGALDPVLTASALEELDT